MNFTYTSADKTKGFSCDLIQKRCEAIDSETNKKCDKLSIYLPYCKNHSLSVLGLEVARSTIPNAGNGVFSYRKFQKGDIICEYIGEIISNKDVEKHYGLEPNDLVPYGVELNSRSVLDSACVRGIGSLANDARSAKLNNAVLIIDKKQVFLQATKKIEIGSEVVCKTNLQNPEKKTFLKQKLLKKKNFFFGLFHFFTKQEILVINKKIFYDRCFEKMHRSKDYHVEDCQSEIQAHNETQEKYKSLLASSEIGRQAKKQEQDAIMAAIMKYRQDTQKHAPKKQRVEGKQKLLGNE